MKPKENARARLGNKRFIFFEIGLCLSLLTIIAVFSYSRSRVRILESGYSAPLTDVELIDITRQDDRVEPAAQQRLQIITDIIKIIDNHTRIDPNYGIFEGDYDELVFLPAVTGGTLEKEVDEILPFVSLSQRPSFMGKDENGFRSWVYERIRYPQVAVDNHVQGRVTVSFVIEKDGSLSDIRILSSPDRSLSDEILRIISASPRWEPGKMGHQTVRSRFTMPVEFKLN